MSKGSNSQHRAKEYGSNTYSNTSSFFFLTILILHGKSAHNHEKKSSKKRETERDWVQVSELTKGCQISQSQTKCWSSRWRYFSVRCSDWWQFATVAKVTHTHTHSGVVPFTGSHIALLNNGYCGLAKAWFQWNAVWSLYLERWHWCCSPCACS